MAFKHLSELLADQKISTSNTSTVDSEKIRQTLELDRAYKQLCEELAKMKALQKEIKEEELIDLMQL